MQTLVTVLFVAMLISLVPISYGQNGDNHFHGGVDAGGSSLQEPYYFMRGDVAKFYGWSNAYQDWVAGIIKTPKSTFQIEIISPDISTVFKKTMVSDDDGNIEFSLSITDDFPYGKYTIRTKIENQNYEPYFEDHKPFYVIRDESDFVSANLDFKIWASNSEIPFGTMPELFGTVCPRFPEGMAYEEFIDPQTGASIYQDTFLINFEITKPDGTVLVIPDLADLFDCNSTRIGDTLGIFDMSGSWDITATAKWIGYGTAYKANSNQITVKVKESQFRSDNVYRISFDDRNWASVIPQDWNQNGTDILFVYFGSDDSGQNYKRFIGIVDSKGKNLRELNVPVRLLADNLQQVLFSRTGDQIYILSNFKIHLFDLNTSETQQLTPDNVVVSHFDIAYNGDLVYSVEKYDKNSYSYSVIRAGSHGEAPTEVLFGPDYGGFDLSYYEDKMVYRKSPSHEFGYFEREFVIYDFAKSEHYRIPLKYYGCGQPPKISPTSQLVIYHDSACSKGWSGGTLGITDLAGTSEILIPATNENPAYFVPSPDGTRLLFSYGGKDIFIMTMAKAIPEFGTIVTLVLVVSILSVVMLARFSRLNL
jgi:predicted secreted protein with PEFG-CTERM motif